MTEMLKVEDLHKDFTLHLRGGLRLPVLHDIALTVNAGECVALVGPSGAGKSTLLRSLYGNYRADTGRILIHHENELVDIASALPRNRPGPRQNPRLRQPGPPRRPPRPRHRHRRRGRA